MKKKLLFLTTVFILLSLIHLLYSIYKNDVLSTGSIPANENEVIEKLVVASDTDFPPFEYCDLNTGEYTGFEIELFDAIAAVNGWEYEIRSMSINEIISSLKEGSADLGISALTIKEHREEGICFSDPYYSSALALVVPAGNEDISDSESLQGKYIGVRYGTSSSSLAHEIPGAGIIEYPGMTQVFYALENGEVDAVVNNFAATAYLIKQGDKKFKIIEQMKNNEYFGIAISCKKFDMLDDINTAIKTLKENDKYTKIYKEWFGETSSEYLLD